MKSFYFFFFYLLYFFLSKVLSSKQPLNEYISHYETLNFEIDILNKQHNLKKRSISSSSPPVSFTFESHKKNFKPVLFQNLDLFKTSNSLIVFDGKEHSSDLSHLYSGFLEGDPNSTVFGSIQNGVFTGRMKLFGENFYIEKAGHYFENPDFHTIIYSENDVNDNPNANKSKRSLTSESNCALSDQEVTEWMKKIQNSAVKKDNKNKQPNLVSHDIIEKKKNYNQSKNKYENSILWRYSEEGNKIKSNKKEKERKKRSLNNKKNCPLNLQTDITLWNYFYKLNKGDANKTKDELISLLASHVEGLNSIYNNVIFEYNSIGPYTGFNFIIYRIQINTTDMCKQEPKPAMCQTNLDASSFLNLHSQANYDEYCLSFVFSYRQFSQGTIGLAWVGGPDSNGGVCERWREYEDSRSIVYRSLNTGILTLSNYQRKVPLKVSILTFGHEVGHNFGSPHDNGPSCIPLMNNPSNPKGNFIMYASATSGNQENNFKFSPCSISNITLNLNSIFEKKFNKFNCFEQKDFSFCGNGIKETGEECDCGYEDMCTDPCCYAKENKLGKKHCTKVSNANCTKSDGPCCTSGCDFKDMTAKCHSATECTQDQNCDGSSAKCPIPKHKPDKTPCNKNNNVCDKGECNASICTKINWSGCLLQAPTGNKNYDPGLLCFIACLSPTSNKCISTGDKEEILKDENKDLHKLLKEINSNGIQMLPGAPCDNMRGYCDVFMKCRSVDEEGPLSQLKKFFSSGKTLESIRQWVTKYWWAVSLIIVGLLILIAAFIKLFAVHTPSSNPKLKKARHLTLKKNQARNRTPSVSVISSKNLPPYNPFHGSSSSSNTSGF